MQLYRRAFGAQDASLVQVSFDIAVIEKYREASAFSLMRTETVGRIKREGSWTLDVGIGEEGETIHACVGELLNALPDSERDHWAQHVRALPMSNVFLQMRLAAGACIDDGELRDW